MRRSRLLGSVLVVTALVGAGCSNDTTTTTATTAGGSTPSEGHFPLGLMVPESGSLNAIVNSLAKPTALAVEQINAAGGINGQQVHLAQADDGSGDAQIASASFDRLTNSDQIKALIGPAGSTTAKGLFDKIKNRQVPTCTGSATASDLSKADVGGYFFRTAPTDDLQGPALADLVTADNHKKVAILNRNDDYGNGFADAVAKALPSNGATVTAKVAYDPAGSNFDGDVGQALAGAPDAVVVIGYNDDGAKIVSNLIAKGAGPDKMPMYTGDGMQSSQFGTTVDPANPGVVAGLKGTAAASNPEGIQSPFQAEFPKLNVDPIYSSYYWDCTNLMALAAHKAKSNDPAAIRDAFDDNVTGENDCNDYRSCKLLLDQNKTIHYRGASNQFDKWNKIEPGGGAYEIWAYDAQGKYSTLKGVPQIKIEAEQ